MKAGRSATDGKGKGWSFDTEIIVSFHDDELGFQTGIYNFRSLFVKNFKQWKE